MGKPAFAATNRRGKYNEAAHFTLNGSQVTAKIRVGATSPMTKIKGVGGV
jgi:hypothetical protein